MMRMRSTRKGSPPAAAGGGEEEKAAEWEVRPGGMLVQKRNPDPAVPMAGAAVPNIRVKVKHGAVSHEIYLSCQSTFGELKKKVGERTGLHPGDQKIMFKDKERESGAYLDTSGVRDGSKVVVVEDTAAQAKRLLEQRRAGTAEKAAAAIRAVAHSVDKLLTKVSALESIAAKGKRVAEGDVVSLTEQLMNQLLKLDCIATADGDVKQQRKAQVRRVQKYVERLDVIKAKNSIHIIPKDSDQPSAAALASSWEMFDLLSSSPSPTAAPAAPPPPTLPPTQRLDWELF